MAARSSADDVHPIFFVVSLVIRLKNPMFAIVSCPGVRFELICAVRGCVCVCLSAHAERNRLTLI